MISVEFVVPCQDICDIHNEYRVCKVCQEEEQVEKLVAKILADFEELIQNNLTEK